MNTKKKIVHIAIATVGIALTQIIYATPALAFAIDYQYQLFPNGDVAREAEFVSIVDGVTSFNGSWSASDAGNTNSSIVQVNLADGSVRLRTESTAISSRGLASARGSWTDTIFFDLPDGMTQATIPFSVRVDGTITGELAGGVSQSFISGQLGTTTVSSPGASFPPNLLGSTYSANAVVFDGQPTTVSLFFQMTIAPLNDGTVATNVVIDSLNSALFTWDLPDGVSYTSESGVFAVVPIPAAGWLLVSGLGLLGWHRRRVI